MAVEGYDELSRVAPPCVGDRSWWIIGGFRCIRRGEDKGDTRIVGTKGFPSEVIWRVCHEFEGTKGWSKSDAVQQNGSVSPASNVNIRCPNKQSLLALFVSIRLQLFVHRTYAQKVLESTRKNFLGKTFCD